MTIRFKLDDRVNFFLGGGAADKIQIDERIGAFIPAQQRCGQARGDSRDIETARAASIESVHARIRRAKECPNTRTLATIIVA
jgi:hypothetical protein